MSKKAWIGIVVAAIIVVVVSVIFRAYLKTPIITQNQRSEMEVEKLNWGVYTRHPAKAKLEEAHILDELDVLVLYYGLLGKPYEASEFAHYFPEYQRSSNEFERRKLAQSVSTRLEKMKQNLLSSTLCVKVEDVRIGEYDFSRKGFPLQKPYAAFLDYSQSATLAFSIINTLGSRSGLAYSAKSYVVFDNIKDNHIFPSFVPMSEDIAQKIVSEFGHGENLVERQMAEAFGQKYQGYRTVFAYVIFEPKKAVSGTSYLEGIRFTTKEVHGNGIYVFGVTPKGTILGVYPNFTQEATKPSGSLPFPSGAPPPVQINKEASYDETRYEMGTLRTGKENISTELSFRQALGDWLEAWKQKNLERYMDRYADYAEITRVTVVDGKESKRVKLTKEQLRNRMKRLFKIYDEIHIEEQSLKIDKTQLYIEAEVEIRQEFTGIWDRGRRKYRDYGLKNLKFVNDPTEGWQIYHEIWAMYPRVKIYQ